MRRRRPPRVAHPPALGRRLRPGRHLGPRRGRRRLGRRRTGAGPRGGRPSSAPLRTLRGTGRGRSPPAPTTVPAIRPLCTAYARATSWRTSSTSLSRTGAKRSRAVRTRCAGRSCARGHIHRHGWRTGIVAALAEKVCPAPSPRLRAVARGHGRSVHDGDPRMRAHRQPGSGQGGRCADRRPASRRWLGASVRPPPPWPEDPA